MASHREQFLHEIISGMAGEAVAQADHGVFVKPDPGRAESRVTSGYQFGDRLVITCDPAATEMLEDAVASTEPTLDGWRQLASKLNGELLGAGRMQTVPVGGLAPVVLAAGYRIRTLDRDNADDVALIAQLIEISSEDDLDEAEIEIDDLDPHICAVLGPDGAIAAYGAARAFDLAESFGDIGVLTVPVHRGKDLGKAVVAEICSLMAESGLKPLYRCDEENAGSIGLSASLGFEMATQLIGYRFAV